MDPQIDLQAPYLIDMLSALTGIALARNADELAMPMFDAVRTFRPNSPRLDSFEGWFCIRRGDLLGATRHLTAAVEALGPDAGPARALLAMVNCAQGNPVWSAQAQTVIEDGNDPSGVSLVRSISGLGQEPTDEPVSSTTGTFDHRRFTLRG